MKGVKLHIYYLLNLYSSKDLALIEVTPIVVFPFLLEHKTIITPSSCSLIKRSISVGVKLVLISYLQ